MFNKQLLAAALLLGGAMSANADDYLIDTKGGHASIEFKFKHLGISWLTGNFETFSGTFTYDPDNIEASTINVSIDPASLDSNHAERDKHLRSDDYLNVAKYPEAGFVSTSVVANEDGTATVIGDLTLHGQTREIEIAASMTGMGDDPWGGYRVGFEGTTTLNTEEFGFKLPPTNKVQMELYLEGIRQ